MSTIIINIGKVASRYGPLFLKGTWVTLKLSFLAVLFGTILGTLIAMMRRSKVKPLSWIARIYIEIVRGTPLLVQLTFFMLILPLIHPVFKSLNSFTCVTLATSLNSAGYVAEIIRAGIDAVDPGQTEASRSLGLSERHTMLRIILPQAVKNILPALCNEFVTIIKETAIAANFFVGDIMTVFKTVSGTTMLGIEPLLIASAIYFVLTFTLSKLIGRFERRLKASD